MTMTEYALATILQDGKAMAMLRTGGRLWPLAECSRQLGTRRLPNDLARIFAGWERHRGAVAAIAASCATAELDGSLAIDAAAAHYLAPLLYPRKVVAIGANYADHMAAVMGVLTEMGYRAPESPMPRPLFFLKPATTAIVGPGPTIRIPPGCRQLDWEIELALIIGRQVTNAEVDEAIAAVAGYTVSLDMSARDRQLVPGTLFGFDFFGGKAHDTGCPMGPVVVPAAQVPDPQDLRMRLAVNGTLRQDASTAGMINSVAETISQASRIMTLEPGDVVLTGTPAGTGVESGTFLAPGDTISATIDGIGTLDVSVRAD
jgi:2-keto-4-pentenoate hydratase/2-oxohepta-3-ene-1,7-dioic acid hydratase in catechol pathway